MSKHTPGPWQVSRSLRSAPRVTSLKSCDYVATCALIEDARLIAASPALLAALQRWQGFMRANYTKNDISWWDETNTAIERALNQYPGTQYGVSRPACTCGAPIDNTKCEAHA